MGNYIVYHRGGVGWGSQCVRCGVGWGGELMCSMCDTQLGVGGGSVRIYLSAAFSQLEPCKCVMFR